MIQLRPEGRFQQVRRLTEVSRALTYAASVDEVVALAIRETAGLLRTERVVFIIKDAEGAVSAQASPAIRGGVQAALREGVSLDEDLVRRLQALLEQDGRQRFLAVPIVIAGEVAGILAAAPAAAAGQGLEEDEWLLSAISDQAAVTLEKLQAHRATAAAEKARRERQEQFESLYESPLIGLVFKDADGTVLDANDAFLELAGYSRAEMEAGSLRWDVLTIRKFSTGSGDPGEGRRRRMRPYESQLVRKDGRRVDVLVGLAQLQEQQRDLAFVVDLTAQKRAEASLQILSETSKALLGASLNTEATFKSIAWLVVPRFADWCAVESVEDGATTGQHIAIENLSSSSVERAFEWRRRFPPDARATIGVAEVIRSGRSQLHEEILETFLAEYACECDGSTPLQEARPRSAVLVPMILHSEVVGVITLVRAGSRRRFTSEDLLLAEEIARRGASAVENARLYCRAQAAVGLRDEFLSIAAHELKTPLTTLQLQVGVLGRAMERFQDRDDTVTSILGSATRQTHRLTRLIEDLLDVSRISTGRVPLNREPCDLVEIVREGLYLFEDHASRQGGTITTEFPSQPVVGNWDRLRIEQVVVNLLSNAFKYAAGKPVHVSIQAIDGAVRLAVRDQGIGISQRDIPRIFDRFERAVSARQYGGLGLGLFISREIVVAHGGEIEVASRPGEGAEFVVKLPNPKPAAF